MLFTLAAEEPEYIVSYVRPTQRLRPEVDMSVAIRPRNTNQVAYTRIERVGPQVEQIPAHQLRDQKLMEWGLPVRIAVPPALNLRPGEIVDLKFFPASEPPPARMIWMATRVTETPQTGRLGKQQRRRTRTGDNAKEPRRYEPTIDVKDACTRATVNSRCFAALRCRWPRAKWRSSSDRRAVARARCSAASMGWKPFDAGEVKSAAAAAARPAHHAAPGHYARCGAWSGSSFSSSICFRISPCSAM